MEIALSRYCGEKDIITKVANDDEKIRTEFGGTKPQNYYIPFKHYDFIDFQRMIYNRERRKFKHHDSALFVKKYLPEDIWNSYYKFCFDRNPWDKIISSYYYYCRKKNSKPSISEFVRSEKAAKASCFDIYSGKNKIMVDKVYLFEQMDEALQDIQEKCGLPGELEMPFTKHKFRKNKAHYSEILSDEERIHIGKIFAREVAHFGYEY